jgi:large subunit ribosomal protein L15
MSMVHDITTGAERNKAKKRKGRGESSGHGKTSGRGNKGSKARNGKYIKPGYEGGQTAIFRRLPKRGFNNENFERRFYVVNLADLTTFEDGATVDAAALIDAGLVPDDYWPVKILGEGEFAKKLTFIAGKYSKSAFEKIQAAGGTPNNLVGELFQFPKVKKKFIDKNAPRVGKAAPAEVPAVEGAAK